MRHSIIFLVLVLTAVPIIAATEEPLTCVVCGMEVKPQAKAGFESTKEGKPVYFCSFSCAHAFHRKYKEVPLFAHDFDTGKNIDVKSAYFLIKSQNLLKEMEFGMAPMVVAFAKDEEAKKTQQRLKDGEVVKGYETLEKTFR